MKYQWENWAETVPEDEVTVPRRESITLQECGTHICVSHHSNSSDGCKEATLLFSRLRLAFPGYILLLQTLSLLLSPLQGSHTPWRFQMWIPPWDSFLSDHEKVTQVWFKAQINRKASSSPGHIEQIS